MGYSIIGYIAVLALGVGMFSVNKYKHKQILMVLFFIATIGTVVGIAVDYNTINEEIQVALEEAIDDAVQIGYFDDSSIARIKHEIKEDLGQNITIEGTMAKKASGEDIFIRAQTKSKSFYISKPAK